MYERGVFRFGVAFLAIFLVARGPAAAESDATILAAPEPDPAAVIAELPFVRTEEPNRIYVDLAPEGSRSLLLLLDTGATFSVMTPLAARALGVSVRRAKSSPYRRATRLGRDLQFWVQDASSDTGSPTGWEYGLLGGNFLEHYVVELDFQERRVRFLDPKRYRVPERVTAPDEAVIPMRVTARRPFTTIEVDGKREQVAIATGAPSPVYLSGKEARKVGLDPDSLPYYGEVGTTMGNTPGHVGEVNSFRFAGFEFGRVPVVVMPRGWFNMAGSSDSVIGYDVLQQFKLRLDYPRGRLWARAPGRHSGHFPRRQLRIDSRDGGLPGPRARERLVGSFGHPRLAGRTAGPPARRRHRAPGRRTHHIGPRGDDPADRSRCRDRGGPSPASRQAAHPDSRPARPGAGRNCGGGRGEHPAGSH
jgi:predicted aspartyl protease